MKLKITKKIAIIFLSLSIFILFLATFLFIYLSDQLNYKPIELSQKIITASQNSHQDYRYNFIILGYDYRQDQFETELNTDTIILAKYQTDNHTLKLISLPRDLWDYQSQQKINRIYQNSLATNLPITNTKSEFSRLTGQPINKILVLSTQNIIELTNLIGGVDIYLEKGFTDDQYPNQAYIDNPKSGQPIYQTISFPSGQIHLDSSNVTQFIRSRKSTDDLDRINRQQLLIEALIQKLKSPSFISNPQNLVNLYNYWQNSIQTDFTDQDLLNVAFRLKTNLPHLNISRKQLEIGTKPQEGDIYHPLNFINRQWVFIPSTPDYSSLKNTISTFLSK